MTLLHRFSILLNRCAIAFLLGAVVPAAETADDIGELGRAPEFALRTLDGEEVSRASLDGKVVVVNFWATWCPDCMNALPTYIALQKQFGDDPHFVFLAVSLDKEPAEFVRKFSERHQINYRVAMGDEALTKGFGGIGEIPTTFIIDRAGTIRYKQAGSISLESVSRLLRSLLQGTTVAATHRRRSVRNLERLTRVAGGSHSVRDLRLRPSFRRRDVVIETENVGRVVPVLECDQLSVVLL